MRPYPSIERTRNGVALFYASAISAAPSRASCHTLDALSCQSLHFYAAATAPSAYTTMFKIPIVLGVVMGLVLAAFRVEAAPANKCVVNGTVTYQQGPCPSDQVRKPPTIQELNAEEKRRRATSAATSPDKSAPAASNVLSGFSCDGRQHCSQMKSCAEAKYFLASCAGVKMDGDRNGIPCEKQWCIH